ncbi:MAG: threonine--tRNA ligase [Promethearchaeota archaeon]
MLINLPDNKRIEIEKGKSVIEIAKIISQRLADAAIVGKVNGRLVDLHYKIEEDGNLEILTPESDEALRVLNHSAAHIMASSVIELFPNAKPTIGPVIDPIGFYYDFYLEKSFSEDDLIQVEDKIQELIRKDIPFIHNIISKSKAVDYYEKHQKNSFKVEILNELDETSVSFYSLGIDGFKDLCRGPHISSTGKVKAVKLLKVSSVYWRGNAERESLQRIYGVAFFNKIELKNHLQMLKEAQKRDHRILGSKLDLFGTAEEFGPGMPIYYPKGTILWDILEKFWKKQHKKAGYSIVKTPHIFRENVWITSGHIQYYKENMYPVDVKGEKWYVKPMNCPGHMMIYNRRTYSYKELPLRFAEYGTVHRYEMSGALHGLFRVRGFTQDDAHIFMLPEQLIDEIINVIDMVELFYKTFGFKEWVYHISTKPAKAIGDDHIWNHATNSLIEALEKHDIKYKIKKGEGAFYGPKIDVDVKDAIGRMWQLATIQVDFNIPKRFNITYIGEDGQKHRPVMIHRVIYGAVDRFIAILIEHYAGKLPIWLSPVQVIIIPITDRNIEYALDTNNKILKANIRSDVDLSPKRMEAKVRDAQLQKIPYIISVGDKEIEAKTVAVRDRDGNVEFGVKLKDFISSIEEDVKFYQ